MTVDQRTATVTVPVELARVTARECLERHGAPEDLAEQQVTHLLEGELRGHPSHGLRRLPLLCARIRAGVLDPVARPTTQLTKPGFAVVDGNAGFGPVAANIAIGAIVAQAAESGIAVAAVSNSNHAGMLSPYVERVAEHGMVGIATTTSEALVHAPGGRSAVVGTNPIALAAPASPTPLVVDLATGIVSMGKVLDYAARNEPLAPGWAVNHAGVPTTDARDVAAIAPFGGGKGYALGLAMEVIVALLTSSALGTDVAGTLDPTRQCNKGDLYIAIDGATDATRLEAVSAFLQRLRADGRGSQTQQQTVPGDRARYARAERLIEGLTLPAPLWQELTELAHSRQATR